MTENLIPPQHTEVTVRAQLLAAAYGAVVGAVVGSVLWVVTGEPHWFYAVPICALTGLWVRRKRPNVLWGQRAL